MRGKASYILVLAAWIGLSFVALCQTQNSRSSATDSIRPAQTGRVSAAPSGTKTLPAATGATQNSNGPDDNEQYPRPEIVVTHPTVAPAPWTLHEQILWVAYIVLAVLGYVGLFLALRTLKHMEHQLERGATLAQAALENAQAALEDTRARARAERPWIVVTVEGFLTLENTFKVVATNRGNSPAKIVSAVNHVLISANELLLPKKPQYDGTETSTLPGQVILLPGESVGVMAFSRDDVRAIAKNADGLQRIREWQEKIFLYGRITYVDLIAEESKEPHETTWCCRYIHGEQTSALVLAGPPEYNRHS